MLRKITRIFFKTLGVLLLFLILVLTGLYFGFQTYSFQTWLGKKATHYLSGELNSKIYVDRVSLEFFSKANLNGVFILDQHNDTILSGDVLVDIKNFDYKKQTLKLDKITLRNTTTKLITYKNDSVFNYQFLIDYFDSGKKDTSTTSQGWDVKFGELILDNVAFTYKNENYNTAVTHTINFDNIGLKNTYGNISGFRLQGDTICATIKDLKTKEQSGFELSQLSTQLKLSSTQLLCEELRLKTPKTYLKGKIDFAYKSWDDYSDFVTNVDLNSELEDSTHINFSDIAGFTPELEGLSETVYLSGSVKGPVSDMRLKNFKLFYGRYTKFNGSVTLSGLPDVNAMYLHFDAKELATNYSDLAHIPSYPFNQHKNVDLPYELKKLGTVSYKGKFDGFLSDFTTYGKFKTALGGVSAQVSIKLGEKDEDFAYHGKISTDKFNLGTLLGQNDLNNLTLSSEINGKGTNIKTLDAVFKGEIKNIGYNGYDYKNITLNGSISDKLFNGLLVSKDPNADFDFNGTISFKNALPEMDFISTVNTLRLGQLKLSNDSGSISSQVFINIKGNNVDNLSGQVNFDNTIYKTKTKTFKLSTFNVKADQVSPDKNIRLTSAYLNANVNGRFQISNLKPAFEAFLYTYYPTFFKKPVLTKKQSLNEDLTFKIKVKKFNTINELFLPDIMLSPGTSVEGNFNSIENKLNIQASSSKASYKKNTINELVFILNENNNTVLAEASGRSLNITDSLAMENFNVALNSVDKDSKYSLDWDNLKQPSNKGELKGSITFDNSSFNITSEKLSITVRDSTWSLMRPSSVLMDKSGSLLINPMVINNNNQSINIAGALSERIGDSLLIQTKNVVLQQFNPALKLLKLKLEGVMDGNITLSNANKNFVFEGDLSIANLKLNDNTIGSLIVNTRYNTDEKVISLNGYTSLGILDDAGVSAAKNIAFNGKYYLDRKDESLDIDFMAAPANLSILNPLLEGILTINKGFVNGSGKVHGTPDNLKIDGKLRLFNGEIKVDYTNVTYLITGDIEIMPDQIRFSDLLLREKGTKAAPQGTVNGNIFHSNFSKIQLDYDITYKNMLVMNTTEKENKTFYGRIFSTGNVGIYGFLNDLNMTINTSTNKNSKFVLPLDGPAEISENGFIRFVKKDTVKTKKGADLTGFNLNMRIGVTPDLVTQIIIDKKTGDVLNVQGHGDLDVRINTLGKFEMFGDYIITNGDYLFTLENVINKKFEIDAGSSISWSGNPMGAEIDVTTTYRQRASVAPLLNDTTYKSRLPVDCKLLITGKLFSPNINFDIDFPNIDATARARINSVLSDEAEMNRQVFSFLLFRTFVTPLIFNAGGGVTAGSAAASTGSEMLSNRVSEFLNTYFGSLTGIRDLQLGLNYRPGNQSNNEAVDLALSKQFLNNKISVDGNFGVNNNQARSNGLIGDVNVDYKLSDDGRFRLKGFNRTNDNTQLAISGGQFTQGVGIFYRKEFETIFKRKLEKMKNKSAPAKK